MNTSLAVLLSFLILGTVSVSGVSVSGVFRGLAGLASQPPISLDTPLQYAYNFSHTDFRGRTTLLQYTSEIAETVQKISDLPSHIQVASCTASSVTLTIQNAPVTVSPIAVGQILSGNSSLGCTKSDGSPAVMQRIVQSVQILNNGYSVLLNTVPASIGSLFKNAHIRFRTNNFDNITVSANNAGTREKQTNAKRRSFSSWLGAAASAIGDIASDVQVAATAVTALATGDYSYSGDLLGGNGDFSYNYDGSGASQSLPLSSNSQISVTCTSCYVTLSAEIDISIDISNYVLQSFSAVVNGNAVANLAATIETSYSGNWQQTIPFGTIAGPVVAFDIGIPVEINVDFPLNAGYSVNADASVSLSSSATLSGNIQYGVQYDGSNWSPVESAGIQLQLSGPQLSTSFNGEASVYIMPSVVLAAYDSLSVGLNIMPFIDADVTASGGADADGGNAQATLTPDYGIQLQVTAGISIVGLEQVSSWSSNWYNVYQGQAGPYTYSIASNRRRSGDLAGDIGGAISGVASEINSGVAEVSSAVNGGVAEVSSAVSGGVAEVSSIISSGVAEVSSAVSGGIAEVSSIISTGTSAMNAIDSGIVNALGSVANFLPSIVNLYNKTCSSSKSCNGNGFLDCVENLCICSNGWTGALCDIAPKALAVLVNSTISNAESVFVPSDLAVFLLAGNCPFGNCAPLPASSLTTCSHLANQPSCIPTEGVAAVDAQVGAELNSWGSVGPRCLDAMRRFSCAARFPSCAGTNATIIPMCYSDCMSAFTDCDFPTSAASRLCAAATQTVAPKVVPNTNTDPLLCKALPQSSRSCQLASGLTYCAQLNGNMISIPNFAFSSPAQADAFVGSLLTAPFASFESETCYQAALAYRCAQYLPLCGANNDAENPILLGTSTCTSILSACPQFSIAGCNASASQFISDTVAPPYYADAYTLQPKSLPPAVAASLPSATPTSTPNTWMIPVIVVCSVVGGVAVGAAIFGYLYSQKKRVVRARSGGIELTTVAPL